jgi:hypothetical protein
MSYLSLSLAAAFLAIGCQAGGSPAASAPQRAVLITTGNGMSSIYIPSSETSGGVVRLAGDKEAPVCKQCQEDAEAYFKGGPLAPTCPVCGASRSPLHATN